MFAKARLKLTFWYLLIIMFVSVFFSTFIYFGSVREFDRILRVEQYRALHPDVSERYFQRPVWEIESLPILISPDPKLIQGTKTRVFEGLALINAIILLFSTIFGYFLAGRTLRPIKEMVDEQNRFITDASHELNTPLTALKTSIEVNLRDKNLSLEKAKKLLLSNLEDVNSLQNLSDELIKLSQYQKPNGNVYFEKVLLTDIVNQALVKVNSLAKSKKIIITTNIPKVSLMGDGKSLVECFVILLDNAVKYSNIKSKVIIKGKKIDSKVEVSIQDLGIGIDKEDLPYIFDRFFRAEKSRTKQQALGYGLGLSIAKRIINLHKGSINVESEIGKGTKFTILFNLV